MLIILYGAPGVGKNYVGEWLAKAHDFYFYDADIHLTTQMRHSIENKRPFTQTMRDAFFSDVITHTQSYLQNYGKVVMAQAISQKKNRHQLQQAFSEAHFVHISTLSHLQQQRLKMRGDWVTPDWLDKLLAIQEPANEEHSHIDNSQGEMSLEQQFTTLFTQWERLQSKEGPVK